MNIRKFFCMLIAGLAIIGFTTVGMASEESTQSESKEATAATAEGEDTAKADSNAESKEEADEKEVKVEGKE